MACSTKQKFVSQVWEVSATQESAHAEHRDAVSAAITENEAEAYLLWLINIHPHKSFLSFLELMNSTETDEKLASISFHRVLHDSNAGLSCHIRG